MAAESLRILLVDDSRYVYRLWRELLATTNDLELVYRQGNTGLSEIWQKHWPDVILLAMDFPDGDGLDILAEIHQHWPVPVLIFSRLIHQRSALALKALQWGVVDFLPPLQREVSRTLRQELLRKVRRAARLGRKSRQLRYKRGKQLSLRQGVDATDMALLQTTCARVVVLAASTGGPQALEAVLSALPKSFPVPILVVQHMPAHATENLVIRLAQHASLRVRRACHEDPLQAGTVLIIPGDTDGTVDGRGRVCLHANDLASPMQPSVDRALMSLTTAFAGKVLAVILTGMGQDGLEGVRVLHRKGGRCLAEDESSCVVYGMPRAVIEKELVHGIAPLAEMGDEIIRQLAQWQG